MGNSARVFALDDEAAVTAERGDVLPNAGGSND
jgi:hypothetical protein